MYIVISRWRAKPGMEAEMEKRSVGPRETLRAQPGVVFVYGMKHCDVIFAIHAYTSDTIYQKVVHDPEGAFAKSVEQSGLEEVAEWVASWRGESVD